MSRAVVFAYTSVGCECLKAMIDAGVEIPLIYTHEDDPCEERWFDSVYDLAVENNIPVKTTTITKENLESELECVKNAAPDVIFSCHYRKLIPMSVLELAPLGAFNMHAALLPKYRGRAPINWAILNGERETGMTLHRMTDKPDAGNIIEQRSALIGPNETASEVYKKVIFEAGMIMRHSLPKILAGEAVGTPQDESKATYFGRRRPADGRIDWSKSAKKIHDLVRAVTWPFPGAFTFVKNPDGSEGRKLMVWRTQVCDNLVNNAEPGTVLLSQPLCVATGKNGMLEILEAQWVDERGERRNVATLENFDPNAFGEALATGSVFVEK